MPFVYLYLYLVIGDCLDIGGRFDGVEVRKNRSHYDPGVPSIVQGTAWRRSFAVPAAQSRGATEPFFCVHL